MVERQDPDNFTRFQTRERCALEIAAYVFNRLFAYCKGDNFNNHISGRGSAISSAKEGKSGFI